MTQVRRLHHSPEYSDTTCTTRAIGSQRLVELESDAIALFRRLDEELYSASGHNPVKLIGSIDQFMA